MGRIWEDFPAWPWTHMSLGRIPQRNCPADFAPTGQSNRLRRYCRFRRCYDWPMANGVRVDVWLWAVRIYRTRTAANTACSSGNVRVNGVVAKPSKTVEAGDRVTTRVSQRARNLEVIETPRKRVGAPVAAKALVDHSPPPEPRTAAPAKAAVREPGAGRPTKRDRRQIDRLRGRDQ